MGRVWGVTLACLAWIGTPALAETQRVESISAAEATETNATSALRDEPVESYRIELLDLSYEAASSYPIVPHIKNRSRAQQKSVIAALGLQQPARAIRYTEGINNWRKGVGYAAVGTYSAKRGWITDAERLLGLAERISSARGLDIWRATEIRNEVIAAYTALGRESEAQRVQEQIEELDRLQAEGMRALRSNSLTFEQKLETMEGAAGASSFEVLLFAAEAFGVLLDQYYENPDRRTAIESKVRKILTTIPLYFRIVTWTKLADTSIAHNDSEQGLKYANEAEYILNSASWDPVKELPLRANLARIRFLCGDTEGADSLLAVTRQQYEKQREGIRNYERADVLRPIAEALVVMGDRPAALEAYRQAINAGAENPNIRPRTDDLTETCISMAVNGIEPDQALWITMRGVVGELAAP